MKNFFVAVLGAILLFQSRAWASEGPTNIYCLNRENGFMNGYVNLDFVKDFENLQTTTGLKLDQPFYSVEMDWPTEDRSIDTGQFIVMEKGCTFQKDKFNFV